MAIPSFTMRHCWKQAFILVTTHVRNPRMEPFIFGQRNGIHILDLQQTVPLLARALEVKTRCKTVAKGRAGIICWHKARRCR